MATVLGFDVGGSGCKAVLCEAGGRLLATGYAEVPFAHPGPGRVEVSPLAWWAATARAIAQVREEAPAGFAAVAGIGVSCTNAIVPVDAEGTPTRDAILLWDQRAIEEAHWLDRQAGDLARRIAGNRIAPGTFSAPSMLWIKRHEPTCFEATHAFLVPGGFIVHRLTDRFTMDESRASTTLLFDLRRREWSDALFDAMDLDRAKLPTAVPSDAIVGEVTTWAARETGLAKGIPVVAGAMDTVAAGLAIGAGIGRPDFLVLGTAARLAYIHSDDRFSPDFMNAVHDGGSWITVAAMNGVGTSLRWFRDQFGDREVAEAGRTGQEAYDLLVASAAESAPGAGGLVYLPYLAGERSPIWDPQARGVLLGLSAGHTRADVIRSLLEGAALAIRHNLDELLGDRARNIPLRIGGGGSHNSMWRRIIADVTGCALQRCPLPHLEAVGAARLAARSTVRLGWDGDTGETWERTVPRRSARNVYDDLYDRYRRLYPAVRPFFVEAHHAAIRA